MKLHVLRAVFPIVQPALIAYLNGLSRFSSVSMDPFSQGVVGAVLAQSFTRAGTKPAIAALFGALAGMAPDLDVLIKSDTDPLLYLEFHRQFTHSLAFIPIGAAIMAGLLYLVFGRRWGVSLKETYLYCLLGWATHGLLDACTSYGTQLLWPFTNERVSFSIISIIDPIFTVPLALLVGFGCFKGRRFGRIAAVWAAFYFSLGAWQHHRALEKGRAIAAERGHEPREPGAKPSFANLLVWKVIYHHEDRYYVDAVRAGFDTTVFDGTSIAELDLDRDFPWLDPTTQQARDVERFRWFSQGYLAQDPTNPARIIDLRYSMIPNEVTGLWSIKLDPAVAPDIHAGFAHHNDDRGGRVGELWRMLTQPGRM